LQFGHFTAPKGLEDSAVSDQSKPARNNRN
jgi:hypothetical protein